MKGSDIAQNGPPACPICRASGGFLRTVDDVPFFRCSGCGSLYAHTDFLDAVDRGDARNYGDAYWAEELASARQRSYGVSVVRVAETVRLSRIPVRRFLDIGSGPGLLLDALAALLPNNAGTFHGIELLPPPLADRSLHPNYRIGTVGDLDGLFDGGVCIEVIEHLTPGMLGLLAAGLAARSTPGALYYFNSAQPSFVDAHDPGYLDPRRRGHVVAWSIEGVRVIFAPKGFNIIPLPGRDWAFFAEFGPERAVRVDDLMSWLWHPVPENLALWRNDTFGPLFDTIGLESARCYLEAARADIRQSPTLVPMRPSTPAAGRSLPASAASVLAWLRRPRTHD